MNRKVKGILLPSFITLIFSALYFYIFIPAINLRSGAFWCMLVVSGLVFLVSFVVFYKPAFYSELKGWLKQIFSSANLQPQNEGKGAKKVKVVAPPMPKWLKVSLLSVASFIALVLLLALFTSSKLFRAADYQAMLDVKEDADFTEDIAEIPISQIPLVDKDTAQRLGSRKIGEVVELVSQFDVSDYYSQINYKNKPFRVSPLQYADILKWFSNRDEGIPYYVSIDMANPNATELVKLDEGMKYSPSEYFSRDLNRHIRFSYPTKMFENLSFEINDEGHPYWVMSYYDYTFGLFGGKDIEGIILVDAVSGKMTDYPLAEVPQWIDLAYSPELAIAQANNYGTLKNGFFNSIFVQRGVVVTTEGYNYVVIDDDVWLYTGITSVSADESNIGFILINMRTKEAKTYMINGAEEFSAMGSAEGKVQEKGYSATFPILINIEDVPSYFLSLKDNAGLVKAYAFVSVTNYQTVGVGDTVNSARDAYLELLDVDDNEDEDELTEKTGVIEAIQAAVVGGNSVYYIMIDGTVYTAQISVSDSLPFLKTGDTVTFKFSEDCKTDSTRHC